MWRRLGERELEHLAPAQICSSPRSVIRRGNLEHRAVGAAQIVDLHTAVAHRQREVSAREGRVLGIECDVRRFSTDDQRAIAERMVGDLPAGGVVMGDHPVAGAHDPVSSGPQDASTRQVQWHSRHKLEKQASHTAFVAQDVAVGSWHDRRVTVGHLRVVGKGHVTSDAADADAFVANGKLVGLDVAGQEPYQDSASARAGPGPWRRASRLAVMTVAGGTSPAARLRRRTPARRRSRSCPQASAR